MSGHLNPSIDGIIFYGRFKNFPREVFKSPTDEFLFSRKELFRLYNISFWKSVIHTLENLMAKFHICSNNSYIAVR